MGGWVGGGYSGRTAGVMPAVVAVGARVSSSAVRSVLLRLWAGARPWRPAAACPRCAATAAWRAPSREACHLRRRADEARRPFRWSRRAALAAQSARICSPSSESLPHASEPSVTALPCGKGGGVPRRFFRRRPAGARFRRGRRRVWGAYLASRGWRMVMSKNKPLSSGRQCT